MEGWLAQLEMDIKPVSKLNHNSHQQYQQSGTMEAYFDEQLAAKLVEDFPCPLSAEGDTPSPQWEFDYNVIEQFASAVSAPHVLSNSENHNVNNNNNNNNHVYESNNSSILNIMSSNVEGIRQQLRNEKKTKKQGSSGGEKRKRQPGQVQEHVIAERKRRELLSQMFISLSAIVPGLKKMDKTSVLREAIKYMKRLQEKVKILEEVAAKRTVESIVIVKKSQLIVDDNDGGDDNNSSCTVDYHSPSGSGGCNLNSGGSREAVYLKNSLPEIEVKLSDNALLLRIYCEEQKKILDTLLAELNKHGMSVTNCSVIPFDNLALDITIVAKMMERGFDFNVKDFVRSIYFALRLNSHQCRASSPDDHSS